MLFRKVSPILCTVKSKISNIKVSSYKNVYEKIKNDKFFYLFLVPGVIGGIGGGGIGFYSGYKATKKDRFTTNVVSSCFHLICGCYLGFVGGLIWPLTLTVFTLRQIDE